MRAFTSGAHITVGPSRFRVRNDLPTFSNDSSWVLPMPARYVIGTDGVIAYADVNPDYTHRADPSELLPVLDRLRRGEAA